MKKLMLQQLCLLGTLFFAGCTHVSPYEKEVLASQNMLSNPMPEQAAFASHVYQIREGTSGAENGFQGGCGCK